MNRGDDSEWRGGNFDEEEEDEEEEEGERGRENNKEFINYNYTNYNIFSLICLLPLYRIFNKVAFDYELTRFASIREINKHNKIYSRLIFKAQQLHLLIESKENHVVKTKKRLGIHYLNFYNKCLNEIKLTGIGDIYSKTTQDEFLKSMQPSEKVAFNKLVLFIDEINNDKLKLNKYHQWANQFDETIRTLKLILRETDDNYEFQVEIINEISHLNGGIFNNTNNSSSSSSYEEKMIEASSKLKIIKEQYTQVLNKLENTTKLTNNTVSDIEASNSNKKTIESEILNDIILVKKVEMVINEPKKTTTSQQPIVSNIRKKEVMN